MQDGSAGVHRSSDVDGRIVYAAWQTVPMSGWRVRVALAGRADRCGAPQGHHRGACPPAAPACCSACCWPRWSRGASRGPLQQLATRGPAGLPGRVPVHEIALLRDALLRAKRKDAAAHDSLQAKAQEFETLFNSSPIGMAFAQDPDCSVIWHNAAMDRLVGPWPSHKDGAVRVLHQGQLLPPDQQPLQRAAALGETVAGMELEIAVEGRPRPS